MVIARDRDLSSESVGIPGQSSVTNLYHSRHPCGFFVAVV